MKKQLINMSEQEVLSAFRHTHLESKDLKFCHMQCRQSFSQDGELIFAPQKFYTFWVADYSDDIVKAKGVFVAIPGFAPEEGGKRAYFVPRETFADVFFQATTNKLRLGTENYGMVCAMNGLRYLVPEWSTNRAGILNFVRERLGDEAFYTAVPRILGIDYEHGFPAWDITRKVGFGRHRRIEKIYYDLIGQKLCLEWFQDGKHLDFQMPLGSNQKALIIGKTKVAYKNKQLIYDFGR